MADFGDNGIAQAVPDEGSGDLIQAAIIDDHPLARLGLAQIVAGSGRVTVSAAVATPEELSRELGETVPDVVICDLYHDGDSPCLEAVAALAGSLRVLVISASARPDDVVGAVRAGAAGYITKHADPDLVLAAVETVAAGGFALSPQLADILHANLAPPATPAAPARRGILSPREEQALSLIADGLTHAQVATRMGVSKATVETYVERIRAKLQVGNKAELARAALERIRP